MSVCPDTCLCVRADGRGSCSPSLNAGCLTNVATALWLVCVGGSKFVLQHREGLQIEAVFGDVEDE